MMHKNEDSESKYLLLLVKENQNFRPLVEKFRDLGAFFTGIGYAFPVQQEFALRDLIEDLPLTTVKKMPLKYPTFKSFKQAQKASFLQDLLYKAEYSLAQLGLKLHLEEIHNLTLDDLQDLNIADSYKNQIVFLMNKIENLKMGIEWARGMEKTVSKQNFPPVNIKFINEKDINFLQEEAPEMPRLVNFMDGNIPKPFIRKGITGMLVGAGGVGKTHGLAQLGLSISSGISWLGVYPIEKPGYVFLGLGENSNDDIHRLLRKIVKSMKKKHIDQNFFEKDPFKGAERRLAVMSFTGLDATFIRQNEPTDFFEKFLNQLKNKEPEEGWACIILDPLSRFAGADAENDNAAATQFIALTERITEQLKGKPTILLGHHMNKSGIGNDNTNQTASRGASALTDGVRWQANLEKTKKDRNNNLFEMNHITIKSVKSNFTVILKPQQLTKDDEGCIYADEKTHTKDRSPIEEPWK